MTRCEYTNLLRSQLLADIARAKVLEIEAGLVDDDIAADDAKRAMSDLMDALDALERGARAMTYVENRLGIR